MTEVDHTFEEEKIKLNERKGHLTSLEKEKKDLQVKLEKMEAHVLQLERNKVQEIAKIGN